jgi:sigma-B regulation protein RsbU (phosphoserine phosphatase)
VDEGLEAAELVSRLNLQVLKHVPGTRFITLFLGEFNPRTGRLVYVNAGQNPPLLRRVVGGYERLRDGGIALGMFEHAMYRAGEVTLCPGDVLVMYSDGVTEAENPDGQPFDEQGLQQVVDARSWGTAKELGWATFEAVERHSQHRRLFDDVTVLVLRHLHPIPIATMAQTGAVSV